MNVLVDTPIWSFALRRHPKDLTPEQDRLRKELGELIREGRAQLIGPIRQEILSGIREESQFLRLREHLRAFDDEPLTARDFEEAAHFSNECRRAGITGSAGDFLICAVAARREWQIFTLDEDFRNYARWVAVSLYTPRTSRP